MFLTLWGQNVTHPIVITLPEGPTIVNGACVQAGTFGSGLGSKTPLHVMNGRQAARFVRSEGSEDSWSENMWLLLTESAEGAEGTIELSSRRISGTYIS